MEMFRRIGLATLIASIALASLTDCLAQAGAAEIQDAMCLAPGVVFISPSDPANGRVGETFTALHTGQLTRAQISVNKSNTSTGDDALDVRALDGTGSPTETILASTTISNASVPSGTSTLTGSFSAPAEVVAGQRYALAVSRPGGSQLGVQISQTNPCPDGELFTSNGAGSGWSAHSTDDASFTVSVTPLPPTPAAPAAPVTGQRAAALKKCKKKAKKKHWSTKKLKKCKKKANLLPV
jgi:hypothetical protein